MIRSVDMLNALSEYLTKKLPEYLFYPGLKMEEHDEPHCMIGHQFRKSEPAGGVNFQVTEQYVITCYPGNAADNRDSMVLLTEQQYEILDLFNSGRFSVAGRSLSIAASSQASEEEEAIEITLEFVFMDEDTTKADEETYDLMQEIHGTWKRRI